MRGGHWIGFVRYSRAERKWEDIQGMKAHMSISEEARVGCKDYHGCIIKLSSIITQKQNALATDTCQAGTQ